MIVRLRSIRCRTKILSQFNHLRVPSPANGDESDVPPPAGSLARLGDAWSNVRMGGTLRLLIAVTCLSACVHPPATRAELIERLGRVTKADCHRQVVEFGIAARLPEQVRCSEDLAIPAAALLGMQSFRVEFVGDRAVAVVANDPQERIPEVAGSVFREVLEPEHRVLLVQPDGSATIVLGPQELARYIPLDPSALLPLDLGRIAAHRRLPKGLCIFAKPSDPVSVRVDCDSESPGDTPEQQLSAIIDIWQAVLADPGTRPELHPGAARIADIKGRLIRLAARTPRETVVSQLAAFLSGFVPGDQNLLAALGHAHGLIGPDVDAPPPSLDELRATALRVTRFRVPEQPRCDGCRRPTGRRPPDVAILACLRDQVTFELMLQRFARPWRAAGRPYVPAAVDALLGRPTCAVERGPVEGRSRLGTLRSGQELMAIDFTPFTREWHPLVLAHHVMVRAGRHRPEFRVVGDVSSDVYEEVVVDRRPRADWEIARDWTEPLSDWTRWHAKVQGHLGGFRRSCDAETREDRLDEFARLKPPPDPGAPIDADESASADWIRRQPMETMLPTPTAGIRDLAAMIEPTDGMEQEALFDAEPPKFREVEGVATRFPYVREFRRIVVKPVGEIRIEADEPTTCRLSRERYESIEPGGVDVGRAARFRARSGMGAIDLSKARRLVTREIAIERRLCVLEALARLRRTAIDRRVAELERTGIPDDALEAEAIRVIHLDADVRTFGKLLDLAP